MEPSPGLARKPSIARKPIPTIQAQAPDAPQVRTPELYLRVHQKSYPLLHVCSYCCSLRKCFADPSLEIAYRQAFSRHKGTKGTKISNSFPIERLSNFVIFVTFVVHAPFPFACTFAALRLAVKTPLPFN